MFNVRAAHAVSSPATSTVVLGPAEVAVMIAEYEASGAAVALTQQRHAINTRALAAALTAVGPQIAGVWRYSGHVTKGLPGIVLRRPTAEADTPPASAHACTDHIVLREDDGEPD